MNSIEISVPYTSETLAEQICAWASSQNDVSIISNGDNLVFSFCSLDYYKLLGNKNLMANSIFSEFINEVSKIKSFGINNGKRIYVDYDKERKVSNRKEKVEKRLGYTAFAKDFNKTNTALQPAEYNKIICGDSVEQLKTLPDNSIDLIFTSPPYNFGLSYDEHNDTSVWRDYFGKLYQVFDECTRVLKYGGRIVINIQPMYSDYIPAHHLISNYFFNKGLIWKSEILWEKNNYNCKYTAWGSWKSPSNPYMKYTWEYLEVFCKGTLKKEGKDADITSDEFKNWVVAKWSIAPERNMKEFDHPAMFPEKLAERVIKLFSFPNDIVLDPFNGAGTTTFVAKQLKRRFIGIDISEKYCRTAKQRLDTGELDL